MNFTKTISTAALAIACLFLCVSSQETKAATGSQTPTVVWSVDLPASETGPIISSVNNLCLASTANQDGGAGYVLSAISLADGHIVWAQTLDGRNRSTPLITKDGMVITLVMRANQSPSGYAYRLNIADGSVGWKLSVPGLPTGVAINAASELFYSLLGNTTGGANQMYSAQSANGQLRWDLPAAGQVTSAAAISLDSKTAYYSGGSFNNKVLAVDTVTGTTKWTFTGDGQMISAPCLGVNGEVFVGGTGQSLYSLNPTNGQSYWRLGLSGTPYSVVVVDEANRVFLQQPNEGKICAVNGNTGVILWSNDGFGYIWNSCALGNDGNLYVAGAGSLRAFRASDGTKQMEWTHGRKVGFINIARDGTILLQDDKLTALRVTGLTGPGTGPWPVFKHDPEGSNWAGQPTPLTYSLSDGLVAYYPFNGNANDESGNSRNATPNNVTPAPNRFGVANKSYSERERGI